MKAEEAAEEARTAPPSRKAVAETAAAAAKTVAADARTAVPEAHRAYGIVSCGAAIGDDLFVANYLQREEMRLVARIHDTTESLVIENAQAAHIAIHQSLQSRADYLLATHFPSETRCLAEAVDLALRDARRRTYGTDLWDTAPLWPNQLDTEFTKDRAELRVKDGGLGARETSERALFLNTMCNIAPAIAGTTDQQSLWPTLRDKAFGPDLLKTDTEGGGWSHFFATGCVPARELASEIERVKRLHQEAHVNSGRGQDPTDPIFGAPTNIFGLGAE